MFVPLWLITILAVGSITLIIWGFLAACGRNPLPFPDNGSRIFAASSLRAKEAIVEVLAQHGLSERFQMDSSGISRSIMMDGTIINVSPEHVVEKLGGASSCIGLVSDDPVEAATSVSRFLIDKGFAAKVVTDAEPNLPIAFVVTDALIGTAINFRKHVIKMPRPTR